MRVIIAGTRSITDPFIVEEAIQQSGFLINTIISGCASGVDTLAIQYAEKNSIECMKFPAKWKNLNGPNVIIKSNKYGKYNVMAEFDRNEKMAECGDALILIWNGFSKGSQDMLDRAKKHGLLIYVFYIENAE